MEKMILLNFHCPKLIIGAVEMTREGEGSQKLQTDVSGAGLIITTGKYIYERAINSSKWVCRVDNESPFIHDRYLYIIVVILSCRVLSSHHHIVRSQQRHFQKYEKKVTQNMAINFLIFSVPFPWCFGNVFVMFP